MKITEEWLKVNGWTIHHYDHPAISVRFHYATKIFGKDYLTWNDRRELKIFRDYEEDSDVYADALIDNVETVEKLNAALELCEIKEN